MALAMATPRGKSLPDRIRSLRRRSYQQIRRTSSQDAMDTSTAVANMTVPFTGMRPTSRASVLSLASIAAMNRLSTVSLPEDHNPGQIEYRLHRAPSSGSSRSYPPRRSFHLVGRIDKVLLTPGADEFAVAAGLFDNNSSCDHNSAVELPASAPNAKSGDKGDEVVCAAGHYSEEEWLRLEDHVEQEADKAREALSRAMPVLPGTVKMVHIKRAKNAATGTGLALAPYERHAYFTPGLAVLGSMRGTLHQAVTRSPSLEELKHDTLPYQAYSGPINPFTSVDREPLFTTAKTAGKAVYRNAKIVQGGSKVELHLPPGGEKASSSVEAASSEQRELAFEDSSKIPTIEQEIFELLSTTPVSSTSWFDDSESSPASSVASRSSSTSTRPSSTTSSSVSRSSSSSSSRDALSPLTRNSTVLNVTQGIMTRRLTRAGSNRRVPPRTLMNGAAYPLFPPRSRTARRPAAPQRVYTHPPALPATYNPKMRFYGSGGVGARFSLLPGAAQSTPGDAEAGTDEGVGQGPGERKTGRGALPTMAKLPLPPTEMPRPGRAVEVQGLLPPRPPFAAQNAMRGSESVLPATLRPARPEGYVKGSRWQRPLSAIPENNSCDSSGAAEGDGGAASFSATDGKVGAKQGGTTIAVTGPPLDKDKSKASARPSSWMNTRIGHCGAKIIAKLGGTKSEKQHHATGGDSSRLVRRRRG